MLQLSAIRPKQWLLALGALAAIGICAAIGGAAAERIEADTQRRQLQVDVALRRELLRSELGRHRLLPTTLAGNPRLAAAVGSGGNAEQRAAAATELNAAFERLAREDGSATLYLIGRDGVTVASSNHASAASFVGQDYSFRPYFRDALANGVGEFFAQGTVSGVPGLYLARRLSSGNGVVVVKVEFAELESRWRTTDDDTFVVDAAGVVLLTTRATQRFTRFDAAVRTPPAILFSSVTAPQPGWTLWVRRDARRALLGARLAGMSIGALLGILTVLALGAALTTRARRERTRLELEALVASRTSELESSNARLMREIDERLRSEASVQKLRDELAQANRLAVLGQISAGVAHEINQPVAAIRTNVDNALVLLEREQGAAARRNLSTIATLTERIGLITQELREFSRRAPTKNEPIRLDDAIDGALLLLESRLRSRRVQIVRKQDAQQRRVLANRTRIEQVVVNLVQNAIEALEGTSSPQIRIEASGTEDLASLEIADNGPGIPTDQRAELFTPFSTTKPFGLGLGLVICRDIISDFGGSIDHETAPEGGACFVIRLPLRVRA